MTDKPPNPGTAQPPVIGGDESFAQKSYTKS